MTGVGQRFTCPTPIRSGKSDYLQRTKVGTITKKPDLAKHTPLLGSRNLFTEEGRFTFKYLGWE